jgi:hypothetical protein
MSNLVSHFLYLGKVLYVLVGKLFPNYESARRCRCGPCYCQPGQSRPELVESIYKLYTNFRRTKRDTYVVEVKE